jgi:hypothetical protein
MKIEIALKIKDFVAGFVFEALHERGQYLVLRLLELS